MTIVEDLKKALEEVPLNVSSTRRGGSNGLRNVDEVVSAILSALPIIVLEEGAEVQVGDVVKCDYGIEEIEELANGNFGAVSWGEDGLRANGKIILRDNKSVMYDK